MNDKFETLTKELSKNIRSIKKGLPEVMDSFSNLSLTSMKDGSLNKKTKELIALAIAVSKRCDGCIGFHIKALVHLKASKEEVLETLGVAVYMGGGPSLMYAAEALKAYDEFST